MRLVPTLLPAIALCGWLTPAALAVSVPSPSNSYVDPCLRVCPGGDMSFRVVVRDFIGFPIANAIVTVDFCQCPEVRLCPVTGHEPYQVLFGCAVVAVTQANGEVVFPIQAGGLCPNFDARVIADGVLLATRAVASPDQDGNLNVSNFDGGLLSAKLGGPFDPTADLDCDGALSPNDLAALQQHLGTGASRPRRWCDRAGEG